MTQKDFNNIAASFQNVFVAVLHEKERSFYTHLFCCTEMRWLFISSTTIWVPSSDTSSAASRARNTSWNTMKCDRSIQNKQILAPLWITSFRVVFAQWGRWPFYVYKSAYHNKANSPLPVAYGLRLFARCAFVCLFVFGFFCVYL